MESKYNELERLNKLKESGTITEQEFEVEKAKILNGKSSNSKSSNGKSVLGKVSMCLFIIGIIVLIVAIIIGIVHISYYNSWDDLPIVGNNGYGSSYERNLWNKVKTTEYCAATFLIIADIMFLVASICQFIKNKENKKKVIILVTEIITIVVITVVYILITGILI